MRCAIRAPRVRFAWAMAFAASFGACVAARSAQADIQPMPAAAFEAYVTGKTLEYQIGDTAYGAEQYLPGRRVVWAFRGQPCRKGHWFPASDGRICFRYQGDDAAPECWHFYREPSGLRAQFLGVGTDGTTGAGGQSRQPDVVEVRKSSIPLQCSPPAAGV